MLEYLKSLQPASLIMIILGLVLVLKVGLDTLTFFFKDYWQERKGVLEKRDQALHSNTMAIMKLEMRLEQLTDVLSIVPKLKTDVDWAHEKIREIVQTTRS